MSQLSPEIQLMRLANACQLSRAVQVAASLRLGHHLRSGARPVAELARATGTDERMLLRLLRFLGELGVVREEDADHFGPTALSERLHLVDNIAQGDESWAVWGALPEALRTGRPVFAQVHEASFYEHAARHPEKSAHWNEWNTLMAAPWFPRLAGTLGLRGTETVVDVGGGEGALLTAVLLRHRGCRGILLDLPQVVAGASEMFALADVTDRATVVAGNALDDVPPGGDVYLLSRVLVNLEDVGAVRLLANCRQAMGAQGLLLVIENLLPDRGDPARRALAASDLNHFLLWGGGHRTRAEMAALFNRAGLELQQVTDLSASEAPGWQILCAEPEDKASDKG